MQLLTYYFSLMPSSLRELFLYIKRRHLKPTLLVCFPAGKPECLGFNWIKTSSQQQDNVLIHWKYTLQSCVSLCLRCGFFSCKQVGCDFFFFPIYVVFVILEILWQWCECCFLFLVLFCFGGGSWGRIPVIVWNRKVPYSPLCFHISKLMVLILQIAFSAWTCFRLWCLKSQASFSCFCKPALS